MPLAKPDAMRSRLLGFACLLPALAAGCGGPDDDVAGDEQHEAEDSAALDQALQDVADGKADATTCSGIITPDQGDFGHRIALTFDDGPNLASTPAVLDILKKHNAPATFFTVGRAINSPAARALLQRMEEEGHMVASHSNSHPNFKTLSATSQQNEITRSVAALATAGVTPEWFRFPYGNGTCAGIEMARAAGMRVVGWQFGSDDWCFNAGHGTCPTSSYKYMPDSFRRDQLGWIRHEVARNHGGVMLNHDSHVYTAQNLDTWLTMLEGEGYSFVRLDDLTVFPKLNGVTPPPPAWIGSVCSDDAACAFSGGSCYDFSLDGEEGIHGFCSVSCQGLCPDKTGTAPTFCADLDGVGRCVSKSHALNASCARIPGTTARAVSRFIGTSSASAATATVCVP